jgi:hypothetical protein
MDLRAGERPGTVLHTTWQLLLFSLGKRLT